LRDRLRSLHGPERSVSITFMHRDVAAARAIIRRHLPPQSARLWLFGSRARGNARRWSDIDIAVEPLRPLRAGLLSEVREALEESSLLLDVDLVDLSAADPPLKDAVKREGIAWND
jgi:predicted nucleotidyltransferase